MNTVRVVACGAAAILAAAAGGCRGREAAVEGLVTVGGKPVSRGEVHFFPAEGSPRSAAIRPDGRYTIQHLPPGPARVGVTGTFGGPAPVGKPVTDLTEAQKPVALGTPVPAKYADPQKSGLTATLTAGRQTHDISVP